MRVFNKRYWPHQVRLQERNPVDKMERYCYENFKTAEWRNLGHYFVFKRSEDLTLFALKWG